jgi:SAM-dependent methyltransferase
MNNESFGQGYADEYDIIYGDKNYDTECDILESAFKRYTDKPIKTVLDMGCGTGNHAIPLARRGYSVTGIDRSPSMLQNAERKILTVVPPLEDDQIRFIEGDVRELNLKQNFDAVIMMFSVLGLQTTNGDVLSALQSVRKHLNPGGVFVFDVWYGPAVLTIRPSDRIRVIPIENGQVIRSASGSLDILHHLCGVHFHLWRLIDSQLINETNETQWTRYFFPQELAFFMEQAKLKLVNLSAFGDIDQEPTDESWNVFGVAHAI